MFNKISFIFLLVCLFLILLSCTDARLEKFKALGNSAKIECYSGGKVIYSGYSTGKIHPESKSDGYYFKDKETDKLMEVSGDCVITYQ